MSTIAWMSAMIRECELNPLEISWASKIVNKEYKKKPVFKSSAGLSHSLIFQKCIHVDNSATYLQLSQIYYYRDTTPWGSQGTIKSIHFCSWWRELCVLLASNTSSSVIPKRRKSCQCSREYFKSNIKQSNLYPRQLKRIFLWNAVASLIDKDMQRPSSQSLGSR